MALRHRGEQRGLPQNRRSVHAPRGERGGVGGGGRSRVTLLTRNRAPGKQ